MEICTTNTQVASFLAKETLTLSSSAINDAGRNETLLWLEEVDLIEEVSWFGAMTTHLPTCTSLQHGQVQFPSPITMMGVSITNWSRSNIKLLSSLKPQPYALVKVGMVGCH